MDAATLFRWVQPDKGPAATPQDLADFAVATLQDAPLIVCNPRDLAALQGTLLRGRVALLNPSEAGTVQPGTLWVLPAEGGR